MTERRVCARCGTALKHHVGGRLCPSCLLRGGLPVEGDGAPGESPSPAAHFLPLPHSFGDYELLEVIARGGMGVVYRARQKSLNRIVAVKMLLAGEFAQPKFIERFRAEAEAVAQLQHPNIVAIHEVGQQDGQQFFSMDYVEGKNLAQVSAEFGARSAEFHRCAVWLKTMAEAVHYAHQRGIIHRDLKPSNVLIDAFDQPRITDFGLAKRLTGDSELTLTGQVLGSPNYLPPEQAAGQPAGVGSDVYALGAVLYHLLTGRPPFEADSLTTLLRQVVEAEPVSPRSLNPGIPRDLETIALKCLEKDPARRYRSAQALAEELGRFLNGQPVAARPVGPAGKAWRWGRRRPALAGMTVALLLSVGLGLTAVLWQWLRAERTAQAEVRQRQRAEAGELFARQNTYAADMHLAQLALDNDNRFLALSLLDKHRPLKQTESRKQKAEIDLRGWEWRYLWGLCQGDESFTLHRYPQPITTLAVSRDGKTLAVGTPQEFALWDLAARRQLTAVRRGARKLTFSPTEDLLAVGPWSSKGQPAVELWETDSGRATKKLTLAVGNLSLAFSPDGRLLATSTVSDNQGIVQVVDWQSGQILTNLTTSPRGGTILAFSPDGRLAIGAGSGRTRLLDLHTGTNVFLHTQLGGGVVALAFSPAADLIAVGYVYRHGTILLGDSRTGEVLRPLTNHTSTINGLVFTPDGRQLVSASRDGTIRVWSVADGTELRCWQSSREPLNALAMLPDGKTLISGGSGGSVCFWDAAASNRAPAYTKIRVSADPDAEAGLEPSSYAPGRLDPRAVCRLGVAFTPDSRRFITFDEDGALALWDTYPTRLIEPLPDLGSNHWGVALSPDGRWLATGESAGTITIRDWTARRVVTNFVFPFEWACAMHFTRNGHYLTASDFNNQVVVRVRLWRTADWREVPLPESQFARVWKVDVSPDDRWLAAGYADGKVKLFRHPSGELEAPFTGHSTGHRAAVSEVAFSPDGRWLASTSMDGSARLWDVARRRELTPEPLQGHPSIILGGALSADGRRLATGGEDPVDTVKLWDPVVCRELLTLRGEGLAFAHVAFSPDGNTVAATAMRGFANLWRAPSWEEIEAAEKRQKAQ